MSSVPVPAVADTQPSREFWIGFGLAAVGAVMFSAKAIVVKLTYRYGVDAVTIIGFRMMLSLPFFAVIGAFQAYRAHRGDIPSLTRKECVQIIVLGFIGYYLSSFLDFLGLQTISAGLERLILFLSPTFVLLITAFYFKRPIARKQWAALVLAYVGVVLVFIEDLSFIDLFDRLGRTDQARGRDPSGGLRHVGVGDRGHDSVFLGTFMGWFVSGGAGLSAIDAARGGVYGMPSVHDYVGRRAHRCSHDGPAWPAGPGFRAVSGQLDIGRANYLFAIAWNAVRANWRGGSGSALVFAAMH